MSRPIVYDATHLVSRGRAIGSAGIGCVDLAYARHFAAHPRLACAAHYAVPRPHLFARERLEVLLGEIAPQGATSPDDGWEGLRAWLLGASETPRERARRSRLGELWRQTRWRLAHDASSAIPQSAIYLNIAQHACEFPLLFDWLSRRPDVRPVFFVHDLLPLDRPEFFRRGYERLFRRRLETILSHACALIATTTVVADRLEREISAHGRPAPPICVQPLASTLGEKSAGDDDPALAESPYFVAVSTLEPRKNHLLLLNVWRALAASGAPTPKLVLVGGRGWENEAVVDMLRRCEALRKAVRWVHDLSAPSLRRLLANANALLMPSFAEGYGMPVVEALALGTPAIVSDIASFREVARGSALFLSPIDGKGWSEAILAFADRRGPRRLAAAHSARDFAAPDWPSHFAGIEAFLARL
ncbi:glycosyltransferase family 1 protein [Methylosinus sp. Sm6]|uniref:glycosyltransferase family 4 protein n=1 Tax=Methylosinus sp. Sm6 TaxID=2866948 RepID=UPI001C99212F|nr:glycosyltransferase family 1 protein [Methylosinus sp. Sm6]MBY6240236.1 glycosyltransferase family 4 protein [Methylosinus sp. Sm6]